jgi:Holliday junction resolvasome RuvABC ATP-dependent DNA helicase subunit
MQINLQHAKVATANLMQITKEESTDILYIQEPYTIQNKVVGKPNKFRTYTIAGTSRAGIVVTNKHRRLTIKTTLTRMLLLQE